MRLCWCPSLFRKHGTSITLSPLVNHNADFYFEAVKNSGGTLYESKHSTRQMTMVEDWDFNGMFIVYLNNLLLFSLLLIG